MKKIILMIGFLSLILPTDFLWAAEQESAPETNQISEEDLEVIQVMEILKLMNLMKEYDMVQDMEILIEEDANENNN